MEWIIQLSGDENDLNELSKVFTSPDLSIKKEKDGYTLRSTQFSPCCSHEEVTKIISEILPLLTAGIKLSLDARKQLEVDGIIQIGNDNLRHYFADISVGIVVRCSVNGEIVHIDGTREEFHQADPIPKWIKVAQKDEKVAKAFQFICADFNSWYNLYKILEVMKEDQFNPVMRGGCYKKIADNFTRTANSYKVTGLDARHAKEIQTPPKNPMSLSGAKSFIKMLLHEWLKEKESKNNV